MIEQKLDELMPGLIHSKSKKSFYDNFKKTIGVYPTLALLGLNSRSQVFMSELKMIAHIAEMYRPIKLLNYDLNEDKDPKVCFVGALNEYAIRFEMQVKIKNEKTDRYYSPDLKLTILQQSNNQENEIESIAIEYEGHSSHVDPTKVKSAFLRNRHITYRTGAPVLPYYKEELKSKKNREITLNDLFDFIKNKIDKFERAAIFASENQLLPINTRSKLLHNNNIAFLENQRFDRIYISVMNLINYIEYQKIYAPYMEEPITNVYIALYDCNSELVVALNRNGRVSFRGGVALIDLREYLHLKMHEKTYLAGRISVTLSKVFKVSCRAVCL